MSSSMPSHLVIITDIEKMRKEDPKISPFAEGGCLYCTHCGGHYNMGTVSFNIALGIYEGFKLDHENCKVQNGMD
jgi:hypothetical protein